MAAARLKGCVLEQIVSSQGSTAWWVRLAYDYQVAGRPYQGDNVAIGYVGGPRHAHAALHERLLGVQPFVVRHHPDRLEVSTILPTENALI